MTHDPLLPLERAAPPPAALRSRVLTTLRARGLLRPAARGGPWRVALGFAAAVTLFAGGMMTAQWRSRAGPDASGRYVLLLYGEGTPAGRGDSALVDEYGRWAADVRAAGRLALGEKLGRAGATLGPPVAEEGAPPVTGLFIVRADSQDEALSIARTCPHLRHGGTIVIRPIVPT